MSIRRFFTGGVAVLACLAASIGVARATTITILDNDAVGEGFNDPTPALPITGNPGLTVGQQRLDVFQAAAAYWANRLQSNVAIRVLAQMDPLTCTPTSALLGAAGATEVFSDFAHAPVADTWYSFALANTLDGANLDSSTEQIDARFNSALNGNPSCLAGIGWFYGIGVPAPAHSISLYETVRHELAHGLGFQTFANVTTGQRFQDQDDAFLRFLEDHSTGKLWLGAQMSDAERAASARDTADLHWVGPHVIAAGTTLVAGRHPSGHVQLYAPATVQVGSSVSHWDTALAPDELMEPIATASPTDIVTTAALQDMGWTLQSSPPASGECTRDASTACLDDGRFEVKVTYTSATAGSGNAQLMSFGDQRAESDDSAFFWFFGPANFEMGLKVLDACTVNDKFWVYIGGLTDQGWTVTIRDTRLGTVKTYSNAIGHLSSSVADTTALPCS